MDHIQDFRWRDTLTEVLDEFIRNALPLRLHYFHDGTIMFHAYCWCERDDCPWCRSCTCPPEAFHHFVDGREVTEDEWGAFFEREVGRLASCSSGADVHDAWMARAERANVRRSVRHDPLCDYCKSGAVNAPNFHYKPTDLKVWWYKNLGGDMWANRHPVWDEIVAIRAACLVAAKRAGSVESVRKLLRP